MADKKLKITLVKSTIGAVPVSYTHLDVYKRQAEKNLLLVKGAVPGPKKALVTIKETTKVEA